MRQAGEVVSKREILDHVWDFDFEGDPNIVEVYVRHLRSKLDEPFGRQSIQTVRGVGLPARRRRWLKAGSARPPAVRARSSRAHHDRGARRGRAVLLACCPASACSVDALPGAEGLPAPRRTRSLQPRGVGRPANWALPTRTMQFIQVLDGDGAWSRRARTWRAEPAVVGLPHPGRSAGVRRQPRQPASIPGAVVAARSVGRPTGPRPVYAGATLE